MQKKNARSVHLNCLDYPGCDVTHFGLSIWAARATGLSPNTGVATGNDRENYTAAGTNLYTPCHTIPGGAYKARQLLRAAQAEAGFQSLQVCRVVVAQGLHATPRLLHTLRVFHTRHINQPHTTQAYPGARHVPGEVSRPSTARPNRSRRL